MKGGVPDPSLVKLAGVAVALFCLMILLSLLGEKTLFLFNGDRALAARVYKTMFTLIGAAVLSLAVPFIVTSFVEKLRIVLAAGDSKSGIALLLLRDNVPQMAQTLGLTLMGVFAIAGIIATITIWIGQ